MVERTEEDKIVQAPVKVILGGKEYEIKPLPIKYSLPWVKEVAGILVNLGHLAKITTDDADMFKSILSEVMIEKPERLVNLFFQYARDLDREAIEENASSAEIVTAFEEVLTLERPLLSMTTRLVSKAMPSA